MLILVFLALAKPWLRLLRPRLTSITQSTSVAFMSPEVPVYTRRLKGRHCLAKSRFRNVSKKCGNRRHNRTNAAEQSVLLFLCRLHKHHRKTLEKCFVSTHPYISSANNHTSWTSRWARCRENLTRQAETQCWRPWTKLGQSRHAFCDRNLVLIEESSSLQLKSKSTRLFERSSKSLCSALLPTSPSLLEADWDQHIGPKPRETASAKLNLLVSSKQIASKSIQNDLN